MEYKKILLQAFSFVCISGIGWLLDFGTYILLTSIFNLSVMPANMISAIPAVTFVFFTSTKKIFLQKESKMALKYKYLSYFVYQLILVTCISALGEYLHMLVLGCQLSQIAFLMKYIKVIIKVVITPITMILNFIIMKLLIERI